MLSDQTKDEVDVKDGKPELYIRRLQVNSVNYPPRKENDWNRKVHSSPIKGYRRLSDQESDIKNQVKRCKPTHLMHF